MGNPPDTVKTFEDIEQDKAVAGSSQFKPSLLQVYDWDGSVYDDEGNVILIVEPWGIFAPGPLFKNLLKLKVYVVVELILWSVGVI